MIDYLYPTIPNIANPQLDGDDTHAVVSHLNFLKVNLLKESYEYLGFDFGETFNNINYKNRIIANPLEFNFGGGGGFGGGMEGPGIVDGNVPVPMGPLPFKGKSKEEKLAMCHVVSGWTMQQTIAAGVTADITFPQTGGNHHLPMNKYIAEDFINICNEILSLGWFTYKVSNCLRDTSTSKASRHFLGVAVDINAGSFANPWFAAHIPKDFPEPAQGASAPWPCKKYSAPPYDRAKCTWHWGHPVVQIFLNHGWGWGGSYGDVMHFSIDGG